MGKERTTLVDIASIDATWPIGPVELFLRGCQLAICGICVSISSMAATAKAWERLARGRVYFVGEWRVLGDAFITYPARLFGVHRNVLILMRLAWCLQADRIDPRRIIWAPGVGDDPRLERKATQFWLRPLQIHELRGAPAAIWALARQSRRVCKGSPTGLWCVDERYLPMLKAHAAQLRMLHILPYRFNDDFALDVKVLFSERALGCLSEAAE